jgi:N-acyl amino acid synthase of PEP-CTERM/exosortase system
MANYLSTFSQHFEIVPALTQEQIQQSQRLRFQVYCHERQILKKEQYPDGIEVDIFDWRSVHALLRHRATGQLAATVRLMLSNQDEPNAEFPIEKRLQYPVYYKDIEVRNLPRSSIAEISRFAISKQFRHRAGDDNFEYEDVAYRDRRAPVISTPSPINRRAAESRRSFPHISLGLIRAIVQMSAANNVQYWYAAMELSFIRLLERFGIHFLPLGPAVDYFGCRQPCIASVNELLECIALERPDVWAFITDEGNLLGGKQVSHQTIGTGDIRCSDWNRRKKDHREQCNFTM